MKDMETIMSATSQSAAWQKIETIGNLDELNDLRQDWNQLAERFRTPLLSHEWFSSCAAAFCPPGRPFVLLLRSNGNIRAIAPLVRLDRLGVEHLEVLGSADLMEPTSFLCDDSPSFNTLANALLDLKMPLILRRLHVESNMHLALRMAANEKSFIVIEKSSSSPWIPITCSWNEFVAHMSSHRRSNLRRLRRRLEGNGRVEVNFYTGDSPDFSSALDEAFRIEASGWKAKEGTAILTNERLKTFFTTYSQAAARSGLARLFLLRLNGKGIAMVLGVEYARRLWILKVGYDESWSRFAPGILLHHESIRWAFERQLEGYEFLGTTEPWIKEWTEKAHKYTTLWLFPQSWKGLLSLGLEGTNVVAKKVSDWASTRLRFWHVHPVRTNGNTKGKSTVSNAPNIQESFSPRISVEESENKTADNRLTGTREQRAGLSVNRVKSDQKPVVVFFGAPGSTFSMLHYAVLQRVAEVPLVVSSHASMNTKPMRAEFVSVRDVMERLRVRLRYDLESIIQLGKPMTWMAREQRLPCISFKDPCLIQRLREVQPDLIISAGFSRIIPAEILALPKAGAFNCHPSPLPQYAGPNPWFWMLRKGEAEGAVTIHRMVPAVDAGPIAAQIKFTIPPSMTYQEFYNLTSILSARTLCELLMDRKFTLADTSEQDLSRRTYFPAPKEEDYRINWESPATTIESLVRASNPRPWAWTVFAGTRIDVVKVVKASRKCGVPGQIAEIDQRCMWVACRDGSIGIRLARVGGKELDGSRLARALGLAPEARCAQFAKFD